MSPVSNSITGVSSTIVSSETSLLGSSALSAGVSIGGISSALGSCPEGKRLPGKATGKTESGVGNSSDTLSSVNAWSAVTIGISIPDVLAYPCNERLYAASPSAKDT